MRKLKYYFIGFIPGLIFVFIILNKKDTSCAYFPNDRVIAETLTKKFVFTQSFKDQLSGFQISEKNFKDGIFKNSKIDFSKSDAQKNPCPQYLLFYPKENPKYEIEYKKCKDSAVFYNIQKIK